MKRLLFLTAILIQFGLQAKAQVPDIIRTPVTPSTGVSRNNRASSDANLYVPYSLRIPRASSFTLNGAKDSIGYVMFNTTSNRFGVYRGSGVWDTYVTTIDANNKVPYTGATADVDLNGHNINTSGNGTFNNYVQSRNFNVYDSSTGGIAAITYSPGGVTGFKAQYLQDKNGTFAYLDDITTALGNYIPLTQKGAPNGVPNLDGAGKILLSQLPANLLIYKGQWNPATNTPTLVNGTGTTGDVWEASTDGSHDFGAGTIHFLQGDFVIYNGSQWQLSGGVNRVTSVQINGLPAQQGIVNFTLTTDNISEGTTNKYYTDARVQAFSDPRYAPISGSTNYLNLTGSNQTVTQHPTFSNGIVINGTLDNTFINVPSLYITSLTGNGVQFSQGTITHYISSDGLSESRLHQANDGGLYIDSQGASKWAKFYGGDIFDQAGTKFAKITDITALSTVYQPLENQRLSTTNITQFAKLGIGTGATRFLDVQGSSEQFRLAYDATHYVSHIVDPSGNYTITPIGTAVTINANTTATSFIKSSATSSNLLLAGGSDIPQSTFLTSATGVSSITGTANQVIRSSATGAVTLSLPQDIATTSTPQFGGLGLQISKAAGDILTMGGSIGGAINSYGINFNGTVQSTVTNSVAGYSTAIGTAAASFNLPTLIHYSANQNALGAGSTVGIQAGFFAQANLIGATTNYGFRGAIPAASGRWNIYMDGTANNYLASSLGVGVTVPNAKIESLSTTEQLRLSYDGTNHASFTIDASGNLTIAPTGGNTLINSSLYTSSTITNSNFWVGGSANAINTSAAQYQFASSTTTYLRTGFYGSTSTTLTTGSNYSGAIFAGAPITTFTSGTHSWLANVAINPIGTVTSGGAAVTNTATLYLGGASTAGTNNYTLYAGGPTYVYHNVANASIPLTVELGPLSTNNVIQQWRYNGSQVAFLSNTGNLIANSFAGNSMGYQGGSQYGQITFSTAGITAIRNVADAQPALIVNNLQGTSNIAVWQQASSTVASMASDGTFLLKGISNTTSTNNAVINMTVNGIVAQRNIADANTAFTVNKVLGIGNIVVWQFGSVTKASIDVTGQLSLSAFATGTAGTDALLVNHGGVVGSVPTGSYIINQVAAQQTGNINITGDVYSKTSQLGAYSVAGGGPGALLLITNASTNGAAALVQGGTTKATNSGNSYNTRFSDYTNATIANFYSDVAEFNVPVTLKGYTVAGLPPAGIVGRITYVTDATAPTYLGTLTGGGSVKTPVFDNGTAWVSY